MLMKPREHSESREGAPREQGCCVGLTMAGELRPLNVSETGGVCSPRVDVLLSSRPVRKCFTVPVASACRKLLGVGWGRIDPVFTAEDTKGRNVMAACWLWLCFCLSGSLCSLV